MEDRLGRVEKKIDTLQEAIISLARVEERLSTVFERQSGIEDKVDTLDGKVALLIERMAATRTIERFLWIVAAAGVTAAFTLFGS